MKSTSIIILTKCQVKGMKNVLKVRSIHGYKENPYGGVFLACGKTPCLKKKEITFADQLKCFFFVSSRMQDAESCFILSARNHTCNADKDATVSKAESKLPVCAAVRGRHRGRLSLCLVWIKALEQSRWKGQGSY